VLRLARQWFPLRLGGIDFSPVVALLLLSFLAGTLGACLTQIGHGASPKVILPTTAIMLLQVLSYLTMMLIILMIARILISLVNPYRTNTLVLVVYGLTEPLLAPLRRWFPKGPKGLDVKAAVFLIGLFLFDTLITDTLVKVSKNWLISLV
jgi:YggT family protein